jgi:hypothetical protein
MTGAQYISIVNQVADGLGKLGIKFKCLNDYERRLGQDGFNWQFAIDPDDPRGVEKCVSYIAFHASTGVIFSELEIPRHVDYFGPSSELKISVARGLSAYDVMNRTVISRIDFLFRGLGLDTL